MNKISFLLLGALAGVFVILLVPRVGTPVGIALNEPSFNVANVTQGTITCRNDTVAASTSLVVATPGRMAFRVYTTEPALTSICRSTSGTCTATSGIVIANGTSALPAVFEQTDAYIGGYTCMGRGATTTVNYEQAL